MKITSDHSALVFPTLLQTHSASNTALAVKKDVQDLELFLKSAALMSRGIVISDSDLNNNSAFYSLLGKSDVVQEAFRSGFIRRAVRQDDHGPADQVSVAQSLKQSNPGRFAAIPEGYVQFLDAMFRRLENQYPPFEWTFEELGSLFTMRLQQLLKEQYAGASPVERSILSRMRAWVLDHKSRNEPVLAARLESDLRPANPSHEEARAWGDAWQVVLNAYNGNVPIAFQGSLIQANNGIHTDQYVPAGPESSEVLLKSEIQMYELAAHGRESQLSIVNDKASGASSNKDFAFDAERLSRLSFPRVLELRDACDPDEIFDVRYKSLGSSEHLVHYLPRLTEAALAYAERLHIRGGVLTKVILQDQIEAAVRQPELSEVYAGIYSPDEVARELFAIVSNLPVQGAEIVACDLSLLKKNLTDLRLSDEDNPISWVFKRPDFRIIQEISARDTADPD
jgi:hypothetical protein